MIFFNIHLLFCYNNQTNCFSHVSPSTSHGNTQIQEASERNIWLLNQNCLGRYVTHLYQSFPFFQNFPLLPLRGNLER